MILGTARIDTPDPDKMDITAKSATPAGKILAPSWDIVKAFKSGEMIWVDYKRVYLDILRSRYAVNPQAFLDIVQRERVILTCYCTDPEHCHRTLAVYALTHVARASGIEVELIGELPSNQKLI